VAAAGTAATANINHGGVSGAQPVALVVGLENAVSRCGVTSGACVPTKNRCTLAIRP